MPVRARINMGAVDGDHEVRRWCGKEQKKRSRCHVCVTTVARTCADFLMGIFSGPSRSTVYLSLGVEFLYAQSKEAQEFTPQKKAGCTAD